MVVIEEKFKKGDYIISRSSGDMAVYDKVDKKGYMLFQIYYGAMFKQVKEKDFTLHSCYQKFYELCNDEEKKALDEIIKDTKENPEKYKLSFSN